MREIKKYLVILYMFLCPAEIALNIIFKSTTKYVGMLVLGAWLATIIYEDRDGRTNISKQVISTFIWLIYCLVSLAWGTESSYTTEYITTYLQMGLLLFICTSETWNQHESEIFIQVYLYGSIMTAVAMNFFGGNEFSGRGTIEILGKYCDSNQVAANIVPAVLISYYKAFKENEYLQKRVFYIAVFLFTTYAVLMTSSRGGLVAIIIGIAVITTIQIRGQQLAIGQFLPIIAIAVITLQFLPLSTRQRLFNFSSYTDEYAYGGSRLTLWAYLFDDFDAQWLIGHGVGSTIPCFISKLGYESGVHNTFLLVLYEVGFVGFAFFIYPYISMIVYHYLHKNVIPCVLIIAAMVSSFFLDALNLRYLWNALIIGVVLYNIDDNGKVNNMCKAHKYLK